MNMGIDSQMYQEDINMDDQASNISNDSRDIKDILSPQPPTLPHDDIFARNTLYTPSPLFLQACEELLTYIKHTYSPIIFHPQDLKVQYRLSDFLHIVIQGNERDDGILIGRQGQTVQALRVFVHAYSKAHLEGISCVVEVRDHRISSNININRMAHRPSLPFATSRSRPYSDEDSRGNRR